MFVLTRSNLLLETSLQWQTALLLPSIEFTVLICHRVSVISCFRTVDHLEYLSLPSTRQISCMGMESNLVCYLRTIEQYTVVANLISVPTVTGSARKGVNQSNITLQFHDKSHFTHNSNIAAALVSS